MAKELEDVGNLPHAVEGVVSHLGGLQLQAIAGTLEAAAKVDDLSTLEQMWPNFKASYQQLQMLLDEEYRAIQ